MTVRVATVLSARDWESQLVAAARTSASVRLVRRIYQPGELDAEEIDVVVAGAETSWVTPSVLANWKRRGLIVIGMVPPGDRPAAEILEAGGADLIVPDDTPAPELLHTLQSLSVFSDGSARQAVGTTVAVVGGAGSPGCSEVALALAAMWSGRRRRVLLIDLDLASPSMAVRLGLPARPDLTSVAGAIRRTGDLPNDAVHRIGGFSVVVGSHRVGEQPIRIALAEDVIEAATAGFDIVVADLGLPADASLVKRSDHAVVVIDGSPVGLVRGARVIAEWSGPPPALVLNRVPGGDAGNVIAAARKWTGLDPAAVIRYRPAVWHRSRRTELPDRSFRRSLRRLQVRT